ncbi:hypothetical protein RB195_025747 [Necator americanus]
MQRTFDHCPALPPPGSCAKLQRGVNLASKLPAAYGLRVRPDKCKQIDAENQLHGKELLKRLFGYWPKIWHKEDLHAEIDVMIHVKACSEDSRSVTFERAKWQVPEVLDGGGERGPEDVWRRRALQLSSKFSQGMGW